MADLSLEFYDEDEVAANLAALVGYVAALTRGQVEDAISSALTRPGRWDVEVWTWSEEEEEDLRFFTETLLVDAGPVDDQPWAPQVMWHPFGTRRAE